MSTKHAQHAQHAQNVHLNQNDNAIAGQINGDTFIGAGAIDPIAIGPTTANGPWWGTDNPNVNYNITNDAKDHIQTALNVHQRQGADTLSSGTGANGEQFYHAPAGTQTSTKSNFSFDYEVNTVHGADTIDASNTLQNYDFKMEISQFLGGSTTAAKIAIFDLNPVTHVWTDEANPLATFGGDDFGNPPKTGATASIMSHVAENSVNLGFAGLQSDFGPLATSTAAGTVYDIKLASFSAGNMLTFTHDNITLVHV